MALAAAPFGGLPPIRPGSLVRARAIRPPPAWRGHPATPCKAADRRGDGRSPLRSTKAERPASIQHSAFSIARATRGPWRAPGCHSAFGIRHCPRPGPPDEIDKLDAVDEVGSARESEGPPACPILLTLSISSTASTSPRGQSARLIAGSSFRGGRRLLKRPREAGLMARLCRILILRRTSSPSFPRSRDPRTRRGIARRRAENPQTPREAPPRRRPSGRGPASRLA